MDIKNIYAKKLILVISSDPHTLVGIKMGLMDFFKVNIASTQDAALDSLKETGAAAVVIHLSNKFDSDFSAFKRLSMYAAEKKIPLLFLAEHDNPKDEIAAFAIGASDYSVKRPNMNKALISRLNLRIHASEIESPPKEILAPELVLKDKTILVAEDVELNRTIIEAILEPIEELKIDFACNGKEAVKFFEDNPTLYPIIFMDIQMPEMDGLTATKTIRRSGLGNARHIPIIALTAGTAMEEIAECLEAGMNAYLEKPMDYDGFLRIIAKYCK